MTCQSTERAKSPWVGILLLSPPRRGSSRRPGRVLDTLGGRMMAQDEGYWTAAYDCKWDAKDPHARKTAQSAPASPSISLLLIWRGSDDPLAPAVHAGPHLSKTRCNTKSAAEWWWIEAVGRSGRFLFLKETRSPELCCRSLHLLHLRLLLLLCLSTRGTGNSKLCLAVASHLGNLFVCFSLSR